MDIEYKAGRLRRNVPDAIAKELIARGLARKARKVVVPKADEPEISPVTGKPKRKYERRDMQALPSTDPSAEGSYSRTGMQAD